jgi:hypothetical protein
MRFSEIPNRRQRRWMVEYSGVAMKETTGDGVSIFFKGTEKKVNSIISR